VWVGGHRCVGAKPSGAWEGGRVGLGNRGERGGGMRQQEGRGLDVRRRGEPILDADCAFGSGRLLRGLAALGQESEDVGRHVLQEQGQRGAKCNSGEGEMCGSWSVGVARDRNTSRTQNYARPKHSWNTKVMCVGVHGCGRA